MLTVLLNNFQLHLCVDQLHLVDSLSVSLDAEASGESLTTVLALVFRGLGGGVEESAAEAWAGQGPLVGEQQRPWLRGGGIHDGAM